MLQTTGHALRAAAPTPGPCAVSQGYAVLVGACFRSVPQILRILRARSAEGVSLTSNVAELLAYSITIAYNLRRGAPLLLLIHLII